MATFLDARDVARLRWRCRRGMLENDLLIERFFERHGGSIDARRAAGLAALMDLADNDLLDLLLARREAAEAPIDPARAAEAAEVLALLRPTHPAAPSPLSPRHPEVQP